MENGSRPKVGHDPQKAIPIWHRDRALRFYTHQPWSLECGFSKGLALTTPVGLDLIDEHHRMGLVYTR